MYYVAFPYKVSSQLASHCNDLPKAIFTLTCHLASEPCCTSFYEIYKNHSWQNSPCKKSFRIIISHVCCSLLSHYFLFSFSIYPFFSFFILFHSSFPTPFCSVHYSVSLSLCHPSCHHIFLQLAHFFILQRFESIFSLYANGTGGSHRHTIMVWTHLNSRKEVQ